MEIDSSRLCRLPIACERVGVRFFASAAVCSFLFRVETDATYMCFVIHEFYYLKCEFWGKHKSFEPSNE